MKNKAVSYCYHSSPFAEELGSHGYYVQQTMLLEDGTRSAPFIAQGYGVFDSLTDVDLLALLEEVEGEHDTKWCMLHKHLESVLNDSRYTVGLEHTGKSEPQYVGRFEGEWIGSTPSRLQTLLLLEAHSNA